MEIFRILRHMDHLIRTKSTGAPSDFARKLSISRRSVYNYLEIMRELGAHVRYVRGMQSYEYAPEGRLLLTFNQENN